MYIFGTDQPLKTFTGKVIAVYHRLNDNEDKWIVSLNGEMIQAEDILETCVLLSHQQVDKYKTVDYTPDGSYMKDVNRYATYKEINEYVE